MNRKTAFIIFPRKYLLIKYNLNYNVDHKWLCKL